MGIYVKFWLFHHANSPNIVMSCYLSCKFQTFYTWPNSTLNNRKVTKFPVEKLSTSEVISQKSQGGGGGVDPPALSGLINLTLSYPRRADSATLMFFFHYPETPQAIS